MKIKAGVRIKGARPELLFGLMVADGVYKSRVGVEMTVTSVKDGVHKVGSKHYTGEAADLRTNDVPKEHWYGLHMALKAQLDEEFDIVLESDHIHLEYDPK